MKKLVTMRKALADPTLLCGAMVGNSWAGWRAMLIAAVGEELDDQEREHFRALTGRADEPMAMIDMWLTVSGRRSGKTTAMAVLIVYLACLCDWSDCLSLGERGLALFLSPTQEQARRAFGYCREFTRHSSVMSELIVGETADGVALSNGVDVEVQAANWRHVRGSTLIACVLDESAFFRNETEAANRDEDLVTALQPGLVTTNGPMLLISSPGTDQGVVYDIHRRHYGADGDPLILVTQADSQTLNPKLDAARIAREYSLNAAASEAEWGGQFKAPIAAYLPRATIEACVDSPTNPRVRLPGISYWAFVDSSSGSGSDSFTCAVGHKVCDEDGRDLLVVAALYEIVPPFDPLEEIAALCAKLRDGWGIKVVTGDKYAGGIIVSAFAKNGLRYLQTTESTSDLYHRATPAWTAGIVRLPNVAKAISQLANLRVKLGSGGTQTIDHPRGGHDDLACAISGLIMLLTPVQAGVNVKAMAEAGAKGLWGIVRAPRPSFGGASEADANMAAWLATQGRNTPYREDLGSANLW